MTTALPTDNRPAGADVLALALEAVRDFPWCFWFRHHEAKIFTVGDVQLVIRRLRQHGGRDAWQAAFKIEQCL